MPTCQSSAVSGTADAPIVFENTLDAAHPHALTYLTIDAAEGSSLTVVQVVRGDAENGVSASLTRIRAAENAHVTLVQVQLLGNRARRWNAVAIEQGKSARVEQVRIELGGCVVACGARTLLNHNKCEYDLDAVYFGHGNDVLDFNDVSVHTGRDTLCEMHTAGVLAGSADKILARHGGFSAWCQARRRPRERGRAAVQPQRPQPYRAPHPLR